MEEKNIACGVRLWTEKTDKFNTSSICFLIRQIASKETATLNSLLLRIMGSNCKKYNTIQKINIQLEELYGASFQYNIVKKGIEQILEFYLEFKTGVEAEAISFLYEIVFNPYINQNSFEIEKKNLEDYLKSKKNDKKAYALERCIEIMCQNEAFGVCCDGYANDLRKITVKDLESRHKELMETSPIEIMAIGNFDFDLLNKLVPSKRIYTPTAYTKNDYKFTGIKKIRECAKVGQSKLCIGLRTNIKPTDKEFFELMVFNEILGGNASSKLFADLRETQSLCYYINSIMYGSEGIIVVQAGIEYSAKDKVVKAVKNLIENMNNDDVEQGKSNIITRYKAMADNPAAIMDYCLAQIVFKSNYSPNEAIEKIRQVQDITHIKCYMDTDYILTGEENGKNNNKETKKRSENVCYS